MIFVTVGSQKFKFDRLLKEIDKLIEQKIINEEVFAQIGVSEYEPVNYKYKNFISQEEFKQKIIEANLIITHAGTGVIVNAVKNEKKVIAIPRLKEYGEHVDNHQIQLIEQFEELNLIEPVYKIEDLKNAIEVVKDKTYNRYISNTDEIIKSIESYINED